MKAINNYQDLTFTLLSKMYRSELQYLTYLQVFDNKVKDKKLKSLLFDLKQSTNYKLHLHHQLIRKLKPPLTSSAVEGLTGIFKEAFLTLIEGGNDLMVDGIMLNTLVQASHYKLGSYSNLSLYFKMLDFNNEISILHKFINTEKSLLRRINVLLQEEVFSHGLHPQLEESVA